MPKVYTDHAGCLVVDFRLPWAPCPKHDLAQKWVKQFPDHSNTIQQLVCDGWTPIARQGKLGFTRNTTKGREVLDVEDCQEWLKKLKRTPL